MADRLLLNGRTLDIERAELHDASGRLLQVRPQALSVLLELARRPGEVVTKRDLMERIWPGVVVTGAPVVRQSAQQIVDAAVTDVRAFAGDSPQHDDITIVVVKVQ